MTASAGVERLIAKNSPQAFAGLGSEVVGYYS